jgi:acyl-CoA hydrolase
MSLTTTLERSRTSRAQVNDACVSAAQAIRAIPNGARIFVHGAAATPTPLLEAMMARGDLEGITLSCVVSRTNSISASTPRCSRTVSWDSTKRGQSPMRARCCIPDGSSPRSSPARAVSTISGGQMDFMHAAARSEGGKPIIARPSTACGGRVSRIVAAPKPGAGVVTTRGHVHGVVTEYGAVNLDGLTLR